MRLSRRNFLQLQNQLRAQNSFISKTKNYFYFDVNRQEIERQSQHTPQKCLPSPTDTDYSKVSFAIEMIHRVCSALQSLFRHRHHHSFGSMNGWNFQQQREREKTVNIDAPLIFIFIKNSLNWFLRVCVQLARTLAAAVVSLVSLLLQVTAFQVAIVSLQLKRTCFDILRSHEHVSFYWFRHRLMAFDAERKKIQLILTAAMMTTTINAIRLYYFRNSSSSSRRIERKNAMQKVSSSTSWAVVCQTIHGLMCRLQ